MESSVSTKQLVLIDSECLLCNRTVNFIIRYDRKNKFVFTDLKSQTGKSQLTRFNIPSLENTVLLIQNKQVLMRSEAILEIVGQLDFPANLLSVFKIIPLKWRNQFYRQIARNRIQWFGKAKSCRLPKQQDRNRFI